MNEKFKGCFIDEGSLYTYDIYYQDELLAKAKTMSAKDRSAIERASMTKAFRDGQMEIDIDTHSMKTHTILRAVTSWELGRAITEDNISMLSEAIRDHLFTTIQDHETKLAEVVEDTEKN